MFTWLTVAGLLGAFGLTFVTVRNRIHALGSERVVMQKQLQNLQEETTVVQTQVAQWSSHALLQKRLDEGFINLQPIPDDRIVRMYIDTERTAMEGLRAVSNKVGMR